MEKFDSDLRSRPTLAAVASRLPESWRGYFRIGKDGSRNVATNSASAAEWEGVLPGALYDRPDGDSLAAALCEPKDATAALDEQGLTGALINPGVAPQLSGLSNRHWSGELGTAINRWTVEEWLPAEPRILAAIAVATHSAEAAAAEVRRFGPLDRVAAAVLGYPSVLLGDRYLHPLYEALEEQEMALLVQAGGAYAGSNGGLTEVGDPASAYEAEASWVSAAQAHLASLVARGTLARFPGLRIIFSGFGAAWLPSLLWRLDRGYGEGRAISPARVEELPSELILGRIRFTTVDLEIPTQDSGRVFELWRLFDEAVESLVFGSGLAGLNGETIKAVEAAVPLASRAAVFGENATALLGASAALR
jgi:predicted TIM-barrel fold metal-dependent hydrolase